MVFNGVLSSFPVSGLLQRSLREIESRTLRQHGAQDTDRRPRSYLASSYESAVHRIHTATFVKIVRPPPLVRVRTPAESQ